MILASCNSLVKFGTYLCFATPLVIEPKTQKTIYALKARILLMFLLSIMQKTQNTFTLLWDKIYMG